MSTCVAEGGVPHSGKLSWIGEKYNFRGENFRGLLVSAMPKDTMPPNFAEKTFANQHKTAKFVKVFFPRTFSAIRYLQFNTQHFFH